MFAPGACGTRISPCKMHIFAFRTILYLCWTDLYLYITRIICRSYCDRKIAKPCLSGFCAKIALRHFASRLTPWCHSTLSQRNIQRKLWCHNLVQQKHLALGQNLVIFGTALYIFHVYINECPWIILCDHFLVWGVSFTADNLDKESPSFFVKAWYSVAKICEMDASASSPLFRMRQLRLVLHCRNDGYLETIGRRGRANIKQSKAKIQQCVSILRESQKEIDFSTRYDSRFPCCVLLALSTKKNLCRDKLSRAINSH